MIKDRHIWEAWARALHRWGLEDGVAALLEAAGPFSMLGAQLIYVGQPLISGAIPGEHVQALIRILEDAEDRQDFVTLLKEVPGSEPR